MCGSIAEAIGLRIRWAAEARMAGVIFSFRSAFASVASTPEE